MRYTENRNGAKHSTPLALEEAQAVFKHLLDELRYYKEQFEAERNIKNNLYAFIFYEGLFPELQGYLQKTDMKSPDGHLRAMAALYLNLSEKTNGTGGA